MIIRTKSTMDSENNKIHLRAIYIVLKKKEKT